MPGVYDPSYGHGQRPNPLIGAFGGGNVNANVNTGGSGAYSGDPGISWRPITYDPSNPFGPNYADASNTVSSVTPQSMFESLQSFFGSGPGAAPTYNGFTPQSAGSYQGSAPNIPAYQGYTAGAFNGPQVSAPGAWGGYDINAPAAWDPSFQVDAGLTDTQDAINAQLPWIEEQRDAGFADAGARAGLSGFAMSSPYVERLGGVARKAASDTQAMAEQFLFQAEESARQRDLQAQMQQLDLEKQAWEAQGNWQMAAQVQEAQNSLASWQTQGGWDMASQLGNQQTGLGAYQTQQNVNAQNAANQAQYGLGAAGLLADWQNNMNNYNLANTGMMNQYGAMNNQGMNNFNMDAWQTGLGANQDWQAFMANMMGSLGYGGG